MADSELINRSVSGRMQAPGVRDRPVNSQAVSGGGVLVGSQQAVVNTDSGSVGGSDMSAPLQSVQIPSGHPVQSSSPVEPVQTVSASTAPVEPPQQTVSVPLSVAPHKEAAPIPMVAPVVESAKPVEVIQPSEPEVEVAPEVKEVVRRSEVSKPPKIDREMAQAGVALSGAATPVVKTGTGEVQLPMSYADALATEKRTKFWQALHWFAALVAYQWRKLDPSLKD